MFYLEAIQKSSLFLECEFTEDFSKGFLSIDCVRATKGFCDNHLGALERAQGLRFLEIEKPKSFERINQISNLESMDKRWVHIRNDVV